VKRDIKDMIGYTNGEERERSGGDFVRSLRSDKRGEILGI
jgi:hypothetical protein